MKNTTYLPEGQRLTTAENLEVTSTLAGLERAMNTGMIVEGVAKLCDSSFNLTVDVGGFEGYMPFEETVYDPTGQPIKDIAVITRVGKPICFCVMGVVRGEGGEKPRLLLSRRAAQRECYHHYLSELCPGDIIPARVTHLESFGAFVDIGCGIVSLLSVDCLSVSRIRHPRERLYQGMNIRVVVKSVDETRHRFFVSMRELLGTWEENAAGFEVGQTVTGIIRSVESYGIFIELTPNLAGLTELREEWKGMESSLIGQSAAVFIKSITPERMKIKLVMIDAFSAPRQPNSLSYYIPETQEHLAKWVYSPEHCNKCVETIFDI